MKAAFASRELVERRFAEARKVEKDGKEVEEELMMMLLMTTMMAKQIDEKDGKVEETFSQDFSKGQ